MRVRWLVTLLLVTGPARADLPDERDHALPCRPTVACTADIVPPGTFEIETGVLHRRAPGVREWDSPLLLKQTFTDVLQLQIGTNGYTAFEGGPRYHDDVVVGPKLHLLDQTDARPSFALSAQASIPTVSATGYTRTYDAIVTAYATKDFGPIHADLNVGVDVLRLDDLPLAQEIGALALSMNVVDSVAIMAESYLLSDASPVAPHDGGLLLAVSLAPRPWLVFDAGADIGFYPTTRQLSVFAGATFVPFVLWRDKR